MTAALADAQTYGPQTDAIAREVAARFNGCVTDINYLMLFVESGTIRVIKAVMPGNRGG